MQLPTKEQRNALYKRALQRFEQGISFGLCAALDLSSVGIGIPLPEFYDLDIFPEIWAQRPFLHESSAFWFPFDEDGIQKRIEILKQAIKGTEI